MQLGKIGAILALALLGCGDDTASLKTSNPGGTAPGGTTPAPGASGPQGAAQTCVDQINAYRATKHLAPYTRWTSAETCSDGEAKSDSASGTAHGAFGTCGEWAQNECPGWPGPPDQMIGKCLEMMWNEGPGGGHYENMIGKYTQAACGFYVKPDGSVWAVQNFK